MRDPFPAPVLPLAQFPRLAPSLGITDVYGMFLDWMAGALGLRAGDDREPGAIQGLDPSAVIRREGMRTHARSRWPGARGSPSTTTTTMRPNHVSSLLAQAQTSRDEVVYGRLEQHAPDGSTEMIGEFPPVNHGFSWQLALQHRALLLFEFPGDWDRARRMLRAGVRFRMVDEVVGDYYPSTLWRAG